MTVSGVYHTCTIQEELKEDQPIASRCLDKLLACLEGEGIYPPSTIGQCLRRNGHSDECVEDLTSEQQAAYIQKTQKSFLQTIFAKKWTKPFVGSFLSSLAVDRRVICPFLLQIPEKKRKGTKDDYANDELLFHVCATTDNKKFIGECVDKVLSSQDPQLIVSACKMLFRKSPEHFIERVKKFVITPIISTKDNKIAEALVTLFTRFKKVKQEWRLLAEILGENRTISQQFQQEITFFSSHSTSQKKPVDVSDEFYGQLEELERTDEPAIVWNQIPDELKKEHAYTYACVLTRARFRKQDEKPYAEIIKTFKETTIADLEDSQKEAIKKMLDLNLLLDRTFELMK